MNTAILSLIMHYSSLYGIDPLLAISVAQKESGFNPNLISKTNDVGLFQLNTVTFRQYPVKKLLEPELNIQLGIRYLAEVRDASVYHEGFLWLNGYNVGPVANTYKHPDKFIYYKQVKEIYDGLKNNNLGFHRLDNYKVNGKSSRCLQ